MDCKNSDVALGFKGFLYARYSLTVEIINLINRSFDTCPEGSRILRGGISGGSDAGDCLA
jgi:hypothetical protein